MAIRECLSLLVMPTRNSYAGGPKGLSSET
jgi:hypothetical protein